MKSLNLLLCGLVVLASQSVGQADTVKLKKAGIEFTLPDGWEVAEDKKEGLIVKTTDKAFIVVGIDLADLTADELKMLKKSPEKIIEQLDVSKIKTTDEPVTAKKNGLKQTRYQGTGKADKKAVEWHLTIVEGGKVPYAVIGYGNVEDNEEELDELLDSIKKIEK